jgi:hypothetical protein
MAEQLEFPFGANEPEPESQSGSELDRYADLYRKPDGK